MSYLKRPEPLHQRAPAVFAWALTALCALALGGCSATVEVTPEKVPPDQVVATLNGEPISLEEFDTEFLLMAIHYSAVTETEMRVIKRNLFEQVVDRRLLVQRALSKGLKVSRFELEKVLREALRDAPSGYRDVLKEDGVPEAAWRRKVAQEFLVRKLAAQEVNGRAQVAPEEVESYYWSHLGDYWKPEAVRARHLVVQTSRELKEAQRRLTAGEPFGKVANAMSAVLNDDGDWGFLPREGLTPAYARVLLALKPGETSKPYKDGFGWHLFQLVEIRPTRMRQLKEVKDEIRNLLLKREQDRLFLQYLAGIKKTAVVKVNQDLSSVVGIVWEDSVEQSKKVAKKKRRSRRP